MPASLPAWFIPTVLGVVGLLLGLWIARLRVRFRAARSRRLGRVGEKRARKALRRAGYRLLREQATRRGELRVDDEPLTFSVRVDAIVERGGERFVAEFKGGADAARVTTRSTRRQLLEYAWLFGCDGVLLVDAAAGRVLQVRFPGLSETGMALQGPA